MNPKATIKGSGNTIIEGNNNSINVTHYHKEPKVQKVVEDHQYNPDIHLTTGQQSKIKEFIKNTHEMMQDCVPKDEIVSRNLYTFINKRFRAPKYSLILQTHFGDVMRQLIIQRSIYRKRLMHIDASRFKEYTIKFINVRWKNMRPNEDINEFASIKLNKKVTDMHKLSVNDLDTLYNMVFSLKK
ncbi:MAG: hypothetical protein LBD41_06965 [Clostridiales Family XIII bacterium]|jgi:hypothetical protein|nr:hypothetical protein [Clostridiales Family XIII bacterium]